MKFISYKRILKSLLFAVPFLMILFIFVGCNGQQKETSDDGSNELSYEQISGEEAKQIIDSQSGYVIIDARIQAEYDSGHIKNAIMIPEYEISEKAATMLPDKEQLILVYCRSGHRSKIAAQALVDLGYTNVKEFGGIIDWKYETEK